jgi:hypothetical protein
MNTLCKLFCLPQINLKLLKTVKTDLENATNALNHDKPNVTNAKHHIKLALIVISVLLKN